MSEATPVYTEEKLFDDEPFIEDDRKLILGNLGIRPNTFLNTFKYATAIPARERNEVFVPHRDGLEHPVDKSLLATSKGYAAEDPNFATDFQEWRHAKKINPVYNGYIVGFPRLHFGNRTMDCVHFWQHNSDIFSFEIQAIPLLALSGLYVYSRTFTDLHVELNELSMGTSESRRYRVPLLLNSSGEDVTKPANSEDIERVIEEMDESPFQVFENYDPLHKGQRPDAFTFAFTKEEWVAGFYK